MERGIERGATARNVIFLHGDGMGMSQRDLVRLATKGQHEDLVMNQLRFAGAVHSDPDDPEEPVTDSAAGATAFASGVRTFNGAIGVDAQERPVPTLLERARSAGKSTGLVTTAQVTDASPAAFGAHVSDRAEQSEIARQFLARSKPNVILGGGEDRWLPPEQPRRLPRQSPKGPHGAEQQRPGRHHRARAAARIRVRLRPRRSCAGAVRGSCLASLPTRRCSSSDPKARETLCSSPSSRSMR